MNLYIAGSYDKRQDIVDVAERIDREFPKITVLASWVFHGEEGAEVEEKGYHYFADLDLCELERSDVVLLVNTEELSERSTGKWFEFGYAHARNKSLIMWGDHQPCIYSHDPSVAHADTLEDVLIILETLLATHKENTWRHQWKLKE